jgi:cell division protein FtsI (penicillin-binding protein 3)
MNIPSSTDTKCNIKLHRLVSVYVFILLWIALIACRLVYLQGFQSEKYKNQAREQQSGFLEVSSSRGEILDRRLEELAISVRADSLFAEPRKLTDRLKAAQLLAPILQTSTDEIHGRLISDRPFVYLGRKLAPGQVEAVRSLGLVGLGFQKESKRVYPGGELASHLLGFVGLENDGLSGLEYLYNEVLKGSKTKIYLRVNAKRESFERVTDASLPDGHTVILNIDRSVQYTTEQVLRDTVEKYRAINGSAIIMDPETGEVLAMASYPTFDPNRYGESDEEDRRNRGILEIYEPGSTFKLITIAGVLNDGLAYPEEQLDCRVGTLRLAGKVYREAKHSHGVLSVNQILSKSSNVGTIKLGLRLGPERFYGYIQRFGFGAKTGIELPGEQTGLLRPPPEWSKISIGALSIGQEIGVTPIQLLRGLATLANGGYLVQPRLVRQILTSQGDVYLKPETQRIRILKAETAAMMRNAMALVVDSGTGQQARVPGYTSAGKTGTAQKFIRGHYSREKYIGSYVGFAPVHDPKLCAIVVINEPQGQYYGGLVAAPAFARIMERALIHLGVPQDRPEPLKDKRLPKRPAARLDLAKAEEPAWSEEELAVESLEATVLSLIGDKRATETSGSVTLSTNWITMPDFSGSNLREVAREGARLGLRIKVSGTGIAVAQRPPAGSKVPRETVCEVFFSIEQKQPDGLKNTDIAGSGESLRERKRPGPVS